MLLQDQVKRMMNGINKMQQKRESQVCRVKAGVTGGDKAYNLEGDECGYTGVFFKRRASQFEAHN